MKFQRTGQDSFAINSIHNRESMEFVMEALSHNNMKTIVGYFADKDQKEFIQKLMDLLNK